MILGVYSVFDIKANAFMPPFYMHNNAIAIRAFTDSVKGKEHAFALNPEDYTLFKLGTWDDNQGEFVNESEALITAEQTLKRPQQVDFINNVQEVVAS